MYPLKFEPKYVEKIWGGQRLKSLKANSKVSFGNKPVGESWEIVSRDNYSSIISNGIYTGMTFDQLNEKAGKELLGSYKGEPFPLLIKFIDANEKLSIQVHPSDKYAKDHENDFGKTEAWYILEAGPDAEIIAGSGSLDRDSFEASVMDGTIESDVTRIKVKKGDFIFIESGLVHAICGSILLAEIQQNSDVTYRVYDYNRGRTLHLDKALEVIDFQLEAKVKHKSDKDQCFPMREQLESCDKFQIDRLYVCGRKEFLKDSSMFSILVGVEGEGCVKYEDQFVNFAMGETIFMPASVETYVIMGDVEFLETSMPRR